MASPFKVDDSTRRLLTLDNFLDGLTIGEFVEELSKNHSLQDDEVNSVKYLDPKPYIRTFESALKILNRLSEESIQKKRQAEKEVERYELQHSQNVMAVAADFDKMTTRFATLDDQVTRASSVIVPLGEKLTKVNRSGEHSKSTIFLIKCYNAFRETGEPSQELKALGQSRSVDDRRAYAKHLSSLSSLAKKLQSDDLPGSEQSTNTIQKYSETFERDLLDEFHELYRASDFRQMKNTADVLFTFNGGSSVVQFFVNQHDFFLISGEKWLDNDSIAMDSAFWKRMSNSDRHDLSVDSATSSLMDEFVEVVKSEYPIIGQVFTDTATVISAFISRCYVQLIEARFQFILKTANSLSALTYVRCLHVLYGCLGSRTRVLKDYFDSHSEIAVSELLDQLSTDLFYEYVGKNKYFEVEKRSFEEVVYSTISRFESENEKYTKNENLRQRIKQFQIQKTLETQIQAHEAQPLHIVDDLTEEEEELEGREYFTGKTKSFLRKYTGQNRKTQAKRFGGLSTFMRNHSERSSSIRDRLKTMQIQPENEELPSLPNSSPITATGTLSLSKVDKILKSCVESLARTVELVPSKAADYGIEILEILIMGIGKSYVAVGLEVSYTLGVTNQLSLNSYSPVILDHLAIFRTCSDILFLLSSCIQTIILPLTANSPANKARLVDVTNGYLLRCELSLDLILRDTVTVIMNRVSSLLSRQPRKEFLAQAESTQDETETCAAVTEFLKECHLKATTYLPEDTLIELSKQMGEGLLGLLFEHLRKFKISTIGGLTLTKDSVHYLAMINSWGIESLTENFTVIKEVANLFLVSSDLIQSLVKEGHLAQLKPSVIRQLIVLRSDYEDAFLQGL
ncbi:unnamed protein product [Kuraishia capsulata CBS 1993]|uniref:Uncharacterized protein n=1 Tax=Kuraishia capsulata CBS 1993 TaxID=1382522 RepID=W6MGG0_9ASCO|nr:uncharacterized protein KUCA_T00000554001 [Kuraishia capsulata CBS 1993]CDK24588.1 unnamed protein product [Kuraishia capsulata CBS 1993]